MIGIHPLWGSFRAVSLISSRQFEFQIYKLLAGRVVKLRSLIKSSDCALFPDKDH